MEIGLLCIKLRERHENGKTWRAVADDYGVTPALVWRIANQGYEPKRAQIRAALGLPQLFPVLCAADVDLSNVLIPRTARVVACRCGRLFLRTSNNMIWCQECEK